MTRFFSLTGLGPHVRLVAVVALIVTLVLCTDGKARAQDLVTNACVDQTYGELSAAQRLFRAVILGQRPAAQLAVGAVRYDRQRRGWIRTGPNVWKTLVSTTLGNRTDAAIDSEAEFPPRQGILETRKARTSDLIPRILQAFRALQCQTRAICLAELQSQGTGAPNVLNVKPPGCINFNIPRFDACRLEQPSGIPGQEGQRANYSNLRIGACNKVRTALIEHEVQMLKLITAYDERSFLQFAGSFDDFLTEFRQPLLLPLWQTVRMLEKLFEDRSCINAQCDE